MFLFHLLRVKLSTKAPYLHWITIFQLTFLQNQNVSPQNQGRPPKHLHI